MSLTWPLGQPWEGERVSGVRWESEWELRWHMRWKMEFAIIEKMPEIQVSRNGLKFFTKNQEKYLKTHGEILLKKYCIVLKLKIPESVIYRLRWNFHKIIKSSEKECR